MSALLDRCTLRQLSWWLPALLMALLLKQHYSVAATNDLQWMLQPLADLLSLITGHGFERQSSGEWLSLGADVRLVKSCAGINFMIMSLLGYAWVMKPDTHESTGRSEAFISYIVMLTVIVISAWATALSANVLRILIAMYLQTDDSIFSASGIDLHRFIGLAVYLPLLSLQMLYGGSTRSLQWLVGPVILYALLMVITPLLTGNAWSNPGLFMTHIAELVLAVVLIQGVIYLVIHKRLTKPTLSPY